MRIDLNAYAEYRLEAQENGVKNPLTYLEWKEEEMEKEYERKVKDSRH